MAYNYGNAGLDDSRNLPEKTFVARNSPLTDIFEENKLIYNVFAAALILVFADEVLTTFVESGRIDLKLREILSGLRGLSVNLLVWSCMQICTLCVYACFIGWVLGRRRLRDRAKKFVDVCCVCGLVIYQVTFVAVTIKAVLLLDLSPVSSMCILMEMTRFVMKIHAFVRSSSSKVLQDNSTIPTFLQFVYFLFAPTLIYCNEYPRTATIRWRVVLKHALEVTILLYMCYIFSGTSPLFNQFGVVPISTGTVLHNEFLSILPTSVFFLCGHYALMHSWLNAWAEVLRFADRLFYRDWWNVTSFAGFVRAHNVVVHNFLYTYVYKDFYDHVLRSKRAASIVAFAVSGLVHELLLAVAFRFFYPIMLGQFLAMGLLTAKANLGNAFFLASLAFANGAEVSLYSMEYYARKNCLGVMDDVGEWSLKGLVPVSWNCGVVSSFDGNWTVRAPWS
ncbi:hypothetical protein pipiens_005646 [Culex pipiens pipiens]|uniref:O-acyltransferase n=1 Tax=Culex pipiens pipiens TaxID=38569 RepID=A0ABD1DUX4_CULPP